jgi:TonB family protein
MNHFRLALFAIFLTGCSGPKILDKAELISYYPEKCINPTTSCAVLIRYTILPNGYTSGDVVVKSSRITQCDRAAIRAIRQWRYSEIESAITKTETMTGKICVQELPQFERPKIDRSGPQPIIK